MIAYRRTDPLYWQRAKHWDDRTRLLGAFLRSCRHGTGEGYYALPVAYAAEDLNWTTAVVTKSIGALVDAGELNYDVRKGVVLIPDALLMQAPTTERQIKGAVARIRSVPVSPLLSELYRLAVAHSKGLAEAMAKELHSLLDQSMAMESEFHSNGIDERIRMSGQRV